MKYVILTIGLLLTLSLSGQDTKNIERYELKGKKYYNSFAFDVNFNKIFTGGFGFRYAAGYKIKKWFCVGGGLGIEYFDYGYLDGLNGRTLYIPLYGELRGELTNWQGIRPFYQLDLGVGYRVRKEIDDLYYHSNKAKGLYFRPQLGWKFKTKTDFATMVGFGYLFQKATLKDRVNENDIFYNELEGGRWKYHRYFIQIGIEF